MTHSTADKILDIAELQVRAGGYNSFSFREISKLIGIKSASIHYHFPTKIDLGVAIATRYSDRFQTQLRQLSETTALPVERLQSYIGIFRTSLVCDQKMCLCGQLASESEVLPEEIRHATQQFFHQNLSWLSSDVFQLAGFTSEQANKKAAWLIASLEGALLMSKVLEDNQVFEQICHSLNTLLD